MRTTLSCLSVRQPWAWLIVNGHKDVENRTWPTRHQGDTLIHAGQVFDREGLAWILTRFPEMRDVLPEHYELGGAVGTCQVLRCVQHSESRWFFGPYGFVLYRARPMPFVPLRGRLGIWEEPITDRLHASLRGTATQVEISASGQPFSHRSARTAAMSTLGQVWQLSTEWLSASTMRKS